MHVALRNEVVEFRVMQGLLIKKLGEDPATQSVIKVRRPVGSQVPTTGKIWVGPQGGEWVELDSTWVEKPGWLLLESFGALGVYGILLERIEANEEKPLMLQIFNPKTDARLCDVCVRPSQPLRDVKLAIAWRFPGLKQSKMQLKLHDDPTMTHFLDDNAPVASVGNSRPLSRAPLGHSRRPPMLVGSWGAFDGEERTRTADQVPLTACSELICHYLGYAEDDVKDKGFAEELRGISWCDGVAD